MMGPFRYEGRFTRRRGDAEKEDSRRIFPLTRSPPHERRFTRRRGDAEKEDSRRIFLSLLRDLFSASPRLRVKQVSVQSSRSSQLDRKRPMTAPVGGTFPVERISSRGTKNPR